MSAAAEPRGTLSPWVQGNKPHPGDVPRDVLIIVGFVMLMTILIAAFGDKGRGHQFPTGTVVAQRSLIFTDGADGSVIVSDAASNKRVAVLPAKSNAFVRTTMRGIAHAGSHEFPVDNHAVLLTLWNDGRLTLDDPLSGRRLDLEAFGQTNAGAYAGLLTGRGLE